jgi:hypothetical protein
MPAAARHMVTPLNLLDTPPTFRAQLHLLPLRPLVVLLINKLLTGLPLVPLLPAFKADDLPTLLALQLDLLVRPLHVVPTVRRWAPADVGVFRQNSDFLESLVFLPQLHVHKLLDHIFGEVHPTANPWALHT